MSSNIKRYIIPSETNKTDKRFNKLKLNLYGLNPPFVLVLLGTCGSGKTSYSYSIIKNLKKYYDIILIYSSTRDSKEAWKQLETKKSDVIVQNRFNPDELEDFLDDIQNENVERLDDKKKPLNTLVLFDDMIFSNTMDKMRGNIIDHIISIHRHKDINVSLLFCSQSYTALSRNLRVLNCSAVFLFQVNKTDLERIAEEHSGLLDKDEFITIFKQLRKTDKYAPFVINYKKPLEKRFSFNNQLIAIKEKS